MDVWLQQRKKMCVTVVLYLLMVVVLPTIVYPNLPLDTIEAIAWGRWLSWGYDKHPYLSAWLAAAAAVISQPSGWALYALSSLCVMSSFYFAWRFLCLFMKPQAAILGLVLSACMSLYTIRSLEFNVNVLLMPLCSLMVWQFMRAVRTNDWQAWFWVGMSVGAGIVTKYTMAIYCLPLLWFCVHSPLGRAQWRRPGLWLAVGAAVCWVLPHIFWLHAHDYVTVQYALGRGGYSGQYAFSQSTDWLRHLVYPGKLLFDLFVPFLPSLGVMLLVTQQRCWQLRVATLVEFPNIVLTLPMLVLLLLAGVGVNVWLGPVLVNCCNYRSVSWRRLWRCLWCLMVLCASGYALACYFKYQYRLNKLTRPYFMGQEMAVSLDKFWQHAAPGRPLRVVLGDRWLSGNVSFYGATHPIAFFTDGIFLHDLEKLRHYGALLILAAGERPDQWLRRLSFLRVANHESLHLRRAGHRLNLQAWVLLPQPSRG
jgi:hypothetical protein